MLFRSFYVTALEEDATIAAPSGTPVNGNKLMIRIDGDGTMRVLTWDPIYREGIMSYITYMPDATGSDTIYCFFIYNSKISKWDLIMCNEAVA